MKFLIWYTDIQYDYVQNKEGKYKDYPLYSVLDLTVEDLVRIQVNLKTDLLIQDIKSKRYIFEYMSEEDEEYDEYDEIEKEFYKMFSLQERKILIEDIEKFHTKYIVEIVNGMLG